MNNLHYADFVAVDFVDSRRRIFCSVKNVSKFAYLARKIVVLVPVLKHSQLRRHCFIRTAVKLASMLPRPRMSG